MRKAPPMPAQDRRLWGARSGAVLAAVGALLCLLLLFLLAARWFQARLIQEARTSVSDQLSPYANNVAVVFNQRLALLEGLIGFAASHTDQEDFEQDFEPFAAGLTAGQSGVQAVQIFRPGLPVYVYPVESNVETLGRSMEDLINDERPAVRADVARAIQTGQPTVGGPYELRHGGVGIVGRQAIFLDGALWGIAAVVLDVDPLLAETGLDSAPTAIALALRTAPDTVFHGEHTVFEHNPVTHRIVLPEGSWELAAVPVVGWNGAIRGPIVSFALVGLSISGLLAGLVYLIVNRQTRLSAAVRTRTSALAEYERRYLQLFENNSDALFLLDQGGTVLDANEVVKTVYGYSPQELSGRNLAELTDNHGSAGFADRIQTAVRAGETIVMDHRRNDDRVFPAELKFSRLHLDQQTRILCAVRDITERKQAEAHIRRLNRLYALLGEINQTIVRFRTLTQLYEQVCEIAVDVGGFRMAWIGLVDEGIADVRVVASAGETGDYLETIGIVVSDDPHGRGPTATAIRSGKHVVSHDIAHDPAMIPWRDKAMRIGFRSSAAFPLTVFGKVRGAYNLYAAEPGFFDADELELLDKLARDISFAMEIAEHEVQRVAAEAARDRFARRMEVLHEIDSSILRVEPLQPMLHSVLAHCLRLVPCRHASIALLAPESGELSIQVLDQDGRPVTGDPYGRLPSAWFATLQDRGTTTMAYGEMLASPANTIVRQLAEEGLRSVLYVPLSFQGMPAGAMILASDTADYFTDEHRKTMTEIGSQLAVAVGQLQLREELAQSNAALRVSEARFRNAVEGAPLPMMIHAEDGEVITLNRIWTEITGYAHEEIRTIGDWIERAYGERREAVTAGIVRLYDLDRSQSEGEFVINCSDGKQRIWDFSSTPLGRLPDGRRIVLSIAADVTERHRAEEARRQRIAELAALFNVASALRTVQPAGEALAILLGETITAVDAGAGAVWLLHKPTGKLHLSVAQGWMQTLEDVALAPSEGLIGKVFTSGLEQRSERWACEPDELSVIASQVPEGWGGLFVPICSGDSNVGVIVLAGRDIAEMGGQQIRVISSMAEMVGVYLDRSRLWQQLDDQAQLTRQIIDTIPECVIVADRDQRLILANPAARATFPEIADLQPADLLVAVGGRAPADFQMPTVGGEPWTQTILGNPPRHFEFAAEPLVGGYHDGGWVLVMRDVTEEHERQRYQLAQERLANVGQLAAGISHDFNNIMGTISLYVELVQKEGALTSIQERHLNVVSDQTRKAATLIHRIMDFSRHSDIESKPVNLAYLCGETVELLQHTLPENIDLEFIAANVRSVVNGDPARLQQALVNLAVNARDAMPSGGRLVIRLTNLAVTEDGALPLPDMAAGDWAVVEVADTGHGIASNHLGHLFEPFFTTKDPTKGTGLGLAQVYGIVKQHNGSIDVRSEPGHGTVFTIYLPVSQQIPELEPERSIRDIVPHGSETVLLVEDNGALRMAVAEMLATLGYQVLTAQDGHQALGLFEDEWESIGLVLSDLGMPQMSGLELLDHLKELNPEIKMIIMSGYLPDRGTRRAQDRGRLAWIEKPFEIGDLAETMRLILDGP